VMESPPEQRSGLAEHPRPAGQPLPSPEKSARQLGLAGLHERPDPLDLLANALDDDTARGQDPQSRSGQRAETGTTGARTGTPRIIAGPEPARTARPRPDSFRGFLLVYGKDVEPPRR